MGLGTAGRVFYTAHLFIGLPSRDTHGDLCFILVESDKGWGWVQLLA